MRYRSTHNKTVHSADYHLIWCPKFRRRGIVHVTDERPRAVIADEAAELGAGVIRDQGDARQILLLVEMPPSVLVSELMRRVTRWSCHLLCMGFPRLRRLPVLWCRSSFMSTVDGPAFEVVRRNVESQKAAS